MTKPQSQPLATLSRIERNILQVQSLCHVFSEVKVKLFIYCRKVIQNVHIHSYLMTVNK